jgi:adenine-specific DNA-methyltransferase
MAKQLQKLELTWIGKDAELKLEPRILIEDPSKSFGDPKSENMLIHGDNLLALKALEQQYTGKIKCIYIDPPYNTGNAFEHYDDGLEHSLWLNLIKPRLEILWNLLDNKSGSLWISIDDSEMAYLKVMIDGMFGRGCFIASIVWQKRYSRENREAIGDVHEYILIYAKNPSTFKLERNLLPLTNEQKKIYKNPNNDPKGPWRTIPITAQAGHATKSQFYSIIAPGGKKFDPPPGNCWRYNESVFKKLQAEGRIYFGKDNNSQPNTIRYLSEVPGSVPWTWWPHDEVGNTDEAKKEMLRLFAKENIFPTPKPERLINRILTIATNPGDLVLDSFIGSGTTCAVAQKMKRRWIGIELGEHAITHCLPRLLKVVSGIDNGGISETVNWKGGGGFKFYTLAPSLVQKDKYGTEIINPNYNANMLAAAMAKQEGFRYQPDENNYWKQGMSSEKDFIFTTTQFVTVAMLDKLAEELQPGESLLVCCKSFAKGCANRHTNITIKKIPQMLLGRCEFGKDDYSFTIVNLPHNDDADIEMEDSEESEAPKLEKKTKARKQKDDDTQSSLF